MASPPQQNITRIDDSPRAQLDALRTNLERGGDEFAKVLPSHITPEQFQRTILTAVASTPDLMKADRQSLLLACMKAAQDGLLPDGREAALVVFSSRVQRDGNWVSVKSVQYMPMVYGLRKKILQSGQIADITCNIVFKAELESGAFIYEEGSVAQLRHRPSMMLTEDQCADSEIIAAYSIATMKDGSKSVKVMRRFEINRVRQTSQTGAEGMKVKFGTDAGKPIPPKGPWVDWFAEMAKKTVLRNHSKSLPMSGDLVDVEAMDASQAAQSTVGLIQSGPAPDAPQRIADRGEEWSTFDTATGEINGETIEGEEAGKGDATNAETGVTTKGGEPLPEVKNDGPETRKARKPREAKPAAPAETGGPAPDGDDGQLPGEREDGMAAKIEEQIANARNKLDVINVMASLPSELTDEAKAYLLSIAEKRKAELVAAATKAS